MALGADLFSPSYSVARGRFIDAANRAGARLESLELSERGRAGELYNIDIAWLGEDDAPRVLLVTSGLHGVEGFAGSAVQLGALEGWQDQPADLAVVMVHALNPWGFAHLRRVNENGVDLNRNFLLPGEAYTGCAEAYRELDALLNPHSLPTRDGFYLRMAAALARVGPATLRQAIAGGQYQYPRGLFFGGRTLEEGPTMFLGWVRRRLAAAESVLGIDLHTGLGPYAQMSVHAPVEMTRERRQRLETGLGRRLDPAGADGGGYLPRGTMGSALAHCLPRAQGDYLTVEFGTRGPLRVLRALREENRSQHYEGGDTWLPAKRALAEVFAPRSAIWREAVSTAGVGLVYRALRFLAGWDAGALVQRARDVA